MNKGTFEYEIRKDFRNNQIVREVDERRLRDLWQSLGIGVVLVLALLFSAWQHFELLRHGYRLEQMQRDRSAEATSTVTSGSRWKRCARRSGSKSSRPSVWAWWRPPTRKRSSSSGLPPRRPPPSPSLRRDNELFRDPSA